MTNLTPDDPAYHEPSDITDIEAIAGILLALVGGAIGVAYCLFPLIVVVADLVLIICNG